jgi:hypothetical protein
MLNRCPNDSWLLRSMACAVGFWSMIPQLFSCAFKAPSSLASGAACAPSCSFICFRARAADGYRHPVLPPVASTRQSLRHTIYCARKSVLMGRRVLCASRSLQVCVSNFPILSSDPSAAPLSQGSGVVQSKVKGRNWIRWCIST